MTQAEIYCWVSGGVALIAVVSAIVISRRRKRRVAQAAMYESLFPAPSAARVPAAFPGVVVVPDETASMHPPHSHADQFPRSVVLHYPVSSPYTHAFAPDGLHAAGPSRDEPPDTRQRSLDTLGRLATHYTGEDAPAAGRPAVWPRSGARPDVDDSEEEPAVFLLVYREDYAATQLDSRIPWEGEDDGTPPKRKN